MAGVETVWTYDDFDRVTAEQSTIDGFGAVGSTIAWTLPVDTWQRSVTYPTGTEIDETYDAAGRLTFLSLSANRGAHFAWLGELPLGRMHDWTGGDADPLRLRVGLDDFGLPSEWTWTVMDVVGGTPIDSGWAARYCRDELSATCSAPLYQATAVRDQLGRIASLETGFGDPAVGAAAAAPVHAPQWAGYTYDLRGRLSRAWTADGVPGGFAGSLSPHGVSGSDIEALGADPSITPRRRDFVRQVGSGSLLGIDQTETGVTTTPWSVQRAAGYTLASGTVFGSQPQFQHDTLGRLVDLDDGFELAFDELDRLVGVTHASGSLVEGYLYDAAGRLVGFYDDEGLLRQLAYDGDQAIAAYDTVEQPGGGWALEARWEAVWGPGLDELIEWRPLGAPTNERFVPLLDHRRSVIGAWRGDDAALAALDGAPASERYVGLGRTRRYDEHGRLSLLAPDGAADCDESTGVLCTLDADEVPFGFVGALRSPVTGLVHMRNRWYSPRLVPEAGAEAGARQI